MRKNREIKIWGVRGSAPRPEADHLEFGGNTTCISVDCGDDLVVLDAGSGLSALGRALAAGGDRRSIHILLSHLHLDHVMGLFSFSPLHNPKAEIHIYAQVASFHRLETLVGPPFWPVGLSDCPASVSFHELWADEHFSFNGLDGYTMAGNHPNGSLLYRLEFPDPAQTETKKSLTYALDCEADASTLPSLTEFSHKTDLLIWDACFMSDDLRPGWGHSTWEQGIRVRKAAQAGTVLMTHYSQDYSDSFLRIQKEKAARMDPACQFAKEGMVITL